MVGVNVNVGDGAGVLVGSDVGGEVGCGVSVGNPVGVVVQVAPAVGIGGGGVFVGGGVAVAGDDSGADVRAGVGRGAVLVVTGCGISVGVLTATQVSTGVALETGEPSHAGNPLASKANVRTMNSAGRDRGKERSMRSPYDVLPQSVIVPDLRSSSVRSTCPSRRSSAHDRAWGISEVWFCAVMA